MERTYSLGWNAAIEAAIQDLQQHSKEVPGLRGAGIADALTDWRV
jgi:hypothetical protein